MKTEKFPQAIPLYQQVLELIESRITKGDFQVGDKLPIEKELASIYHVSRTVIREAMKVLKEKGWVETRVAKGTFVVSTLPSGVDSSFDFLVRRNPEGGFNHLIEVRLILEPEIAALAAVRANDDQINRMQNAILLMDEAIANSNDVNQFLKGDFDFHMVMAESAGNPFIRMIMSPVVNLMRDSQRYHLSHVVGGNQSSQHNHKLEMEAIKDHDPILARKYMYEHIVQVRDDVKQAEAGEDANRLINPTSLEIRG